MSLQSPINFSFFAANLAQGVIYGADDPTRQPQRDTARKVEKIKPLHGSRPQERAGACASNRARLLQIADGPP